MIKTCRGLEVGYRGPKVHAAAASTKKEIEEYDFSSSDNDEEQPSKGVGVADAVPLVNQFFLISMNFYHHLFYYGNDFIVSKDKSYKVFLTSGVNGPKW